MGQNSSQLQPPSQSQGDTQPTTDTPASTTPIDRASMDDPATREDELRLKKKKRKISGDATRPAKKSKKEERVNGVASHAHANGEIESSQVDGSGEQDAAGEIVRKRSKKRSKREQALLEDNPASLAIPVSQSSFVQDSVPESSAQVPDSTGPTKEAKKKRKRFTGRPSGLNLLPAGMEIPATQDQPTQDETTQGEPALNGVEARIASPKPTQTKTKKSKRREDAPGHPSPAMTNAQSSQIVGTATKSPKSKSKQPNGVSGNEHNDEEMQSTSKAATKSPKSSKKRESRKQKVAESEMLPTPPEAAQSTNREPDEVADSQIDALAEVAPSKKTPREKGRRKSKQAQAIDDDDAAPYEPAPSSSKKRGQLSQQNGEPDQEIVSKRRKAAKNEPVTPVRKASKKKSRPITDSDHTEEDEADENVGRSSKSTKVRKSTFNDDEIAKGPFTEDEKEMVDALFKETLEESGMTESEFRESLKHWKTATDFKEAVHNALPNRTTAAIRKFCQRRYHNLSRGAWTPEDDASLRSAYAATPDKWTDISALVGRTPADCKDRWKNTVSIQDTQQLGPWSQEETAALIKAVDQCFQELKKSNKEFKRLGRFELERMLSWAAVSKKLDGARSAKRCNEKWQKLKKSAGSSSIEATSTTTNKLATGLDKARSSKKLRAIESKYNQCDVGDLYDILTEIHTAIPDHTRHFDHESTLWAIVSTKNSGSRFNSAMRRRGLYDAADVYAADLQLANPENATLAAVAKALCVYLEGQWGQETLQEKRSYWPDKLKKEQKIKSKDRVESSDDDEDEDEVEVDDEDEDAAGDDGSDETPKVKREKKMKSKERVETYDEDKQEEQEDEEEEEEEGGDAVSDDSPAVDDEVEDDDAESSGDNTKWKAVNS